MRGLGLVLVAVALLLGSGGVAYRSQAESQLPQTPGSESQQIGMTEIPSELLARQSAKECAPRSAPARIELLARPGASSAIVLNTQGYNYRRGQNSAPLLAAPPAAPDE